MLVGLISDPSNAMRLTLDALRGGTDLGELKRTLKSRSDDDVFCNPALRDARPWKVIAASCSGRVAADAPLRGSKKRPSRLISDLSDCKLKQFLTSYIPGS